MNFSDIELPSNQKFGFFFTAIFIIAALFSFYIDHTNWFITLSIIGISFFIITIINSDILLPLNKLWMRFGVLLGMIISPIVMGVIFFVIFTPMAIFMRFFGRDELSLRVKTKTSHWINRKTENRTNFFKNQF